MIDKASAAGWVVEVVTLSTDGPPSFKYFNAAIADRTNAVHSVRKLRGVVNANRVEAVRELSAAEIAALKLKADQIKPA